MREEEPTEETDQKVAGSIEGKEASQTLSYIVSTATNRVTIRKTAKIRHIVTVAEKMVTKAQCV
jgi:hypothetical protein